jgi:hypothetical protein
LEADRVSELGRYEESLGEEALGAERKVTEVTGSGTQPALPFYPSEPLLQETEQPSRKLRSGILA